MIKHILVLLALLAPAVQADSKQTAIISICSSMATSAQEVMTVRQLGVEMDQMMLELDKRLKDDTPIYQSVKQQIFGYIVEAYSRPRYSSTEYQQDAIREFKSKAFAACYKGFIDD